MARPYEDLEATYSPDERRQIRKDTRMFLGELMLREIHGDRRPARQVLARVLGVDVADLVQMEQQVAIELAELEFERGPEERMGTTVEGLENTVAALGGQVRITAVFPEGEVEIRRVDKPANSKAAAGGDGSAAAA